MPKVLVIAEKPSVARDLASALPGSFQQAKEKTHLVGDDYVTWAVGHLVGLAEPDAYDPKLKKWRFADLPILPERFKLVPTDERAAKQLRAIHRLMADDDVERIMNACDAGREGELIFAYVFETAGVEKPVDRLWLSSMTRAAISEAFERLRPGQEMKPLEAAARSRSEADWVVGMNATRAASVRLRAAFDGAVSLGRVQTPTLALVARREEEIRAFRPEPYWLVEARFAARGERLYLGRYLGGRRLPSEAEAAAIVAACTTSPARSPSSSARRSASGPAPLRPHDAPAPREHALRVLGPAHACRGAAALRGAQGADLPPHELALSDRRHGGGAQADRRASGPQRAVRGKAAAYVTGLEQLPLQRVVNDKRVQDHHAIIPTRSEHDLGRMGQGRAEGIRPGGQALPGGLPPRGRLRAHAGGDHRRRSRVPHQRAGARHRGLAGGLRGAGRPRQVLRTTRWRSGLPKLEQGEPVETREVESLRKETSRRGDSPRRRCWRRWRQPARRSRRPSCARR